MRDYFGVDWEAVAWELYRRSNLRVEEFMEIRMKCTVPQVRVLSTAGAGRAPQTRDHVGTCVTGIGTTGSVVSAEGGGGRMTGRPLGADPTEETAASHHAAKSAGLAGSEADPPAVTGTPR